MNHRITVKKMGNTAAVTLTIKHFFQTRRITILLKAYKNLASSSISGISPQLNVHTGCYAYI